MIDKSICNGGSKNNDNDDGDGGGSNDENDNSINNNSGPTHLPLESPRPSKPPLWLACGEKEYNLPGVL